MHGDEVPEVTRLWVRPRRGADLAQVVACPRRSSTMKGLRVGSRVDGAAVGQNGGDVLARGSDLGWRLWPRMVMTRRPQAAASAKVRPSAGDGGHRRGIDDQPYPKVYEPGHDASAEDKEIFSAEYI
ncbi:hypothetical protein M6B38_133235 [Iris pallida]|uniref:Uncharacterized protein n=1 Tax=Iris pallida TaxID=29817 RepID=A0AAX6FHK2_IRIPA|nr:hypothetical protein M6B38_133235 [Iris pallida]